MWTGVNIFTMTNSLTPRSAYHHGDLRNALIAAGAKLAERGGPEAVGIRAAAREVGVTPTAAYRHFANADDLREAVKNDCMKFLVQGMQSELAGLQQTGDDPAQEAVERLIAMGRGYIKVAVANPGSFRAAFGASMPEIGKDKERALKDAQAFHMLSVILDELVDVGYLPKERRPYSEFAAWAAVHGLARLILDGPLAGLPSDVQEAAIDRTLATVAKGL